MFCTKCGKQLPEDSKFCVACGKSVSKPIEKPAESMPTESTPAGSADFTSPAVQTASKAAKGMSKGLLWGIIGGGIALIVVVISIFVIPEMLKSDEDLINDCLDSFTECYNEGDMEGAIEYFTPAMQSAANIGLGITDALMSDALGFDIGMGDMFGLGAGLNDGDMLTIVDREITVDEGAETATVIAVMRMNLSFMGQSMNQDQPIVLTMQKIDGDWYIAGMQE